MADGKNSRRKRRRLRVRLTITAGAKAASKRRKRSTCLWWYDKYTGIKRKRAQDGEVTIMYVIEEGEKETKSERGKQVERERRNRKGWRGGKTTTPKSLPLPYRPSTRGADGRHRYFTQSTQSERIERSRPTNGLRGDILAFERLTPYANFRK